MDVSYKRPTEKDRSFTFEDNVNVEQDHFSSVRFASAWHLFDSQNRVLNTAEVFVNHLKEYELPDGVSGLAIVMFRLFTAVSKKGIIFHESLGEVGYPRITVSTDLGSSEIRMNPGDEYLSISVLGGGLADKTVEASLDEVVGVLRCGIPKVHSYGFKSGPLDTIPLSREIKLPTPS